MATAVVHKNEPEDIFSAVDERSIETIKRCLEQGTDIDEPNDEGITPLSLACESGYLDVISVLLENGASVSTINGFAPIHAAAEFGHTEAVKLLLDNSADIESVTYWGATALHVAAGHDDVTTTRLLLERGADKNALNSDGETALMIAVSCGGLQVVKLFVAHGCDLEMADRFGDTPFVKAAFRERFDVADFLHESGASLETSPKQGQTSLHYAASLGRFKVVQFLCSKMDLTRDNLADSFGNTPLHLAAQSSHAATVELLLRHGIDQNCKNNNGDTAIFGAIASNSIQTVKFLLEKGPNLEICDSENHVPLEKACSLSNMEMITLLFRKTPKMEKYLNTYVSMAVRRKGGAMFKLLEEAVVRVAAPNRSEHLLYAVEAGNADILQLFLDTWPEMQEYIRSDTTAVSTAINMRKYRTTRFLLENGSNIDQVRIRERPALHYAIHVRDSFFVEIFLKNGADLKLMFRGHTPLLSVMLDMNRGSDFRRSKTTEICKMLLEKNDPGLECTTPSGLTALHVAVAVELMDVLELIIDKGADMEATLPDCGSTPLLVACEGYNMEIARLLIKKGCNLEATNNRGRTALYRAVANHYPDMARFLLSYGADPEHGNSGWTPLHRATQYGDAEMVRVLLDYDANPEASHDGVTPLSNAVSSNHPGILERLLKGRDAIDVKPDQALLNEAARLGHAEVVKVLLDNGAEPGNEGDVSTPLGNAIQYRHTGTVEALLMRGAWPRNCKYKGDYVKKAARHNEVPMVRMLLALGAGLDVSSEHRRTALHHAAGHGNLDIVECIVSEFPDSLHVACGCCRYLPIHYAASEGHLEVLKYLLGLYTDAFDPLYGSCALIEMDEATINSESRQCKEEGRSGVNIKSSAFGATALHRAARKGHENIVEYLLNHEADQSMQTFRGATPLSLASRFGRADVVKLLLEHPGHDLATHDVAGRTPLFLAASRGHCRVIETLLAAPGMEESVILQKDMYGATAISVALRNGHEKAVMQLLKAARPPLDSLDFGGKPLSDRVELMADSDLKNLLLDPKLGDSDAEIDQMCEALRKDGQSKDEDKNNNATECSVCLKPTTTTETLYYCGICHARIFRKCQDCFDLGLGCPFESHNLSIDEEARAAREAKGEEGWIVLAH